MSDLTIDTTTHAKFISVSVLAFIVFYAIITIPAAGNLCHLLDIILTCIVNNVRKCKLILKLSECLTCKDW